MATTYYKRDTNPTNNNWNQADNWSTVASNSATNGGTYPVAGDTAILDAGSIQVTVNVASATAVLNCTSYNNTITMTNALTVTGGVTLSSKTVFSGTGAMTLGATQAVTPGGCTSPVAVSVGAYTITITGGDFYSAATVFTGAATINNDGTSRNLKVSGNISGNFAIAGSAVLYIVNTISWANTNTTGNSMPVVIDGSGKTITVSSTVYLRNSSFTVTNGTLSGGTLRFTTSCTITGFGSSSTTAITFAGTSQTYTLGAAITTTGAMACSGTTLITVASGGFNMSFGAITVSTASTFTGAGTVAGTNWTPSNVTLTISSNWTLSGTITQNNSFTISGSFTFQAATLNLTNASTVTLTGTSLNITGATTMTNGLRTVTFSGSGTVTTGSFTMGGSPGVLVISSDWTVTGTTTLNSGGGNSATINGAHNFKVGGDFSQSSQPVSGTATIFFNGTTTWTGGATAALSNAIVVNTAGTLTISGTVQIATGGFTFTAGTITGGTIAASSGFTLDTNSGGTMGCNWTFGTATYTLASNFATSLAITITNTSPTFSGAFNITCATLSMTSGTTTNRTLTLVANQTITVTTNLNLLGDAAAGITTTIKSATASTKTNLTYQGTYANLKVFNVIFTDVDASGASIFLFNYQGGTLTRTINIINVTGADVRKEGCLGAGAVSQNSAKARGGTGFCVDLAPSSTTDPYYWIFLVPVTASVAFKLSLYHEISSGFNGTMNVTIYDTDDTTKLVNADSVSFTDDGAYHNYQSAQVTPTGTGFCRVVLKCLKGAVGTDIYIDDVALV